MKELKADLEVLQDIHTRQELLGDRKGELPTVGTGDSAAARNNRQNARRPRPEHPRRPDWSREGHHGRRKSPCVLSCVARGAKRAVE
jgi:hypothetical protein